MMEKQIVTDEQEQDKNELVKMLKDSFLTNKEAAQKNIVRSFENFCVQNGHKGIFFTEKNGYIAQNESGKKEPITDNDCLDMFLGAAAAVLEYAQNYFPQISTSEFKTEIVAVVGSIIQAVIVEHGTFCFNYDVQRPNFFNRKGEIINLVTYLSIELGKIK